jgi:hypothetical protein
MWDYSWCRIRFQEVGSLTGIEGKQTVCGGLGETAVSEGSGYGRNQAWVIGFGGSEMGSDHGEHLGRIGPAASSGLKICRNQLVMRPSLLVTDPVRHSVTRLPYLFGYYHQFEFE